jgi:hypothetical protein
MNDRRAEQAMDNRRAEQAMHHRAATCPASLPG